MKRLHVHVSVADLDRSVAFYSALFGAGPTVLEDDYAKWMLDDPRVNFAVSARGAPAGVDHLGIQVETDEELAELRERLPATGGAVLDQGETVCCYARSDKAWVTDPQGVAWEAFHSLGASDAFGEDRAIELAPTPAAASCCGPSEPSTGTGCCG